MEHSTPMTGKAHVSYWENTDSNFPSEVSDLGVYNSVTKFSSIVADTSNMIDDFHQLTINT